MNRVAWLLALGIVAHGLAGLSPCLAQAPTLAIGGAAGDTVGITWKLFDPEQLRTSYEATAGWTIRDENAFEFRWMCQRTLHEFRSMKGPRLQVYAGAGLRVKLERDTRYGLRGALGVTFLPMERDIAPEIFLEAAPTRDISPDHRSTIGLATGVRWRL
jgi:hypothetical protein